MEWFFGDKGLKFSEIGCRPPGVRAWDLYCAANEMDVYREWAACIVHGRKAQKASRRYSAGIVTLRPESDGRIAGYEGLDRVEARFGEWVIDVHLPPPGTPTQPVEAGYMANGVGPHAAPGLRRTAQYARRGRPVGQGSHHMSAT